MDELFATQAAVDEVAAAGYAQVALEQGIDAAAAGLTYAIPPALAGLRVGERVTVPLGRGNKRVSGYVLSISEATPQERVKAILARDAGAIALPADLVELARWIAGYYCAPIGMVLATMLPAAVKRGVGNVNRTLVALASAGGDAAAQGDAAAAVGDGPTGDARAGEASAGSASAGDATPPAEGASKTPKLSKLQRAVLAASRELAAAGRPWVELRELADQAGARTVGPVKQLLDRGLLRTRQEVAVAPPWEALPEGRAEPRRALDLNPPQAAAVDRLAATVHEGFSVHLLHGVTGSGKTEVYLRVIEKLMRGGRGRGDEGTEGLRDRGEESYGGGRRDGGTEARTDGGDDGRGGDAKRPGAIVLVPEIALTPQTVARFLGRFEGVAVLHSGLTPAQRHHQWRRIAAGEANIVIGARSAVFAPVRWPAVIIVDEEHEQSYKQDQLPRYHARDVAIRRGQILGIPVVLGSATPSLESYYNAQPIEAGGEPAAGSATAPPAHASAAHAPAAHAPPAPPRRRPYHLLRLPERVANLKLPDVVIVDMSQERRKRYTMTGSAGVHLLSLRLEAELRKLLGPEAQNPKPQATKQSYEAGPTDANSQAGGLDSHPATRNPQPATPDPQPTTDNPQPATPPPSPAGQAILLLNRRGYANYIACPDQRCGWLMNCENCDATMVYHRDATLPLGGLVRCHHCTLEQLLPEQCPFCAKRVSVFGLGTQRVEEELARKFPGARLLRMDSDAMRSARDYERSLDRFRRGEIDVLLGTQMIAKGLDFPNVRLVGVISADTALNLPDFRASERTFQLIAQVAGRAGRGERPGLVVVQTFSPEDPAIVLASRHDYEAFAARELALRREVGLPPITRLARIVVRDRDHVACAAQARTLADHLAAFNVEAGAPVRLRGPMPCPLARIANHYRQQIELIAPDAATLQRLLTRLRNARLLKSDAHTAVDVDPVALL